ncbi:MAG: ATP-binding cassette domain-containing protein [Lachnospiraceae bacterium]
MNQLMVKTLGLTKKSKTGYRVHDLDMAVPAGSIYGFLGPNGAGKSTTLKMLLGMVHETGGEIEMLGERVTKRNRLQILSQTGSLIESPSYYSHLTGEENLKIVQTLKDVSQQQIGEVLEIVRLTGQKDKKVNHYSMGMKQRLGLAAALLGYPKLLILDEPTNGLDPGGIQEMRELICSLPQKYDMTVLMSSHLLSEIDQIANNVGVIDKGALVFQGEMKALHDLSQSYILLRTLDNTIAEKELRSAGIHTKRSDSYLRLPLMDDQSLADCICRLILQGIQIVRIEQQSMTLEDIFLELTGKAVSL